MRKKVLALALALVMVIAMLPTVAFAAEDPALVTDENGLKGAITSVQSGGTIKLDQDIALTSTLSISNGVDFTIDLNGHKLKGNLDSTIDEYYHAFTQLITITSKSGTAATKVTIADSSADKKGGIEAVGAADSGNNQVINIQSRYAAGVAELILKDGIAIELKDATGTNGGAIVTAGNSKLTIEKANVTSSTFALNGSAPTTSTLIIKDGVFKGKINGSWKEGSSVEGGYFSEFPAGLANILGSGKGLVATDEEHADMFKVGTALTSGNASVKIGENTIYGDLQTLFDLYRSKANGSEGQYTPLEYEVYKDSELTIHGYGKDNPGVYDHTNTLIIKKAAQDANETVYLKITMDGIKVAKVQFIGLELKDTPTGADGYEAQMSTSNGVTYTFAPKVPTATEWICKYVPADGGEDNALYYDATTIKSFLGNLPTNGTITFNKESDDLKESTYTLSGSLKIPASADLTIDLGGCTVKYTGSLAAIVSTEGGKVTVKNGTIDASESESGMAVSLGITEKTKMDGNRPTDETEIDTTSKGTATIGDKAVIKGTIGVFNSDSQLTMEKGSSVEAEGFAIAGNGAHDGTTITIKNGATVKSNTTAAIYHPQEGRLTIGEASSQEKAPEITGVAGVVVRDGEVTVNDATITATGTGDIKVGDAETTVPAGGIVLDSVTGYGTGDEKVTVKDATVTVKEGQPTVTYTEAGETPDYSTEGEAAPNTHIEVTAGTYQSGEGKADPNMVPFISDEVKENSGLASDGEIKTMISITNEAPFLVDFGYLAAAPQKGQDDKWTSPNGITYTVTDWGDGTFYWCFNRKLTATEIAQNDDKGYAVTFTAPNGESVTDYCHATSPRFASSLLNKDQLGSAPLTTGNWTIKTGTSEVTVPVEDLPKSVADAAPVVAAATIADKDGATDIVTEGYTAEVTGVNKDGNYIITGTATGLKSHKNGAEPPVEGYWFGVEIEAPEGVITESGTYTVSDDVTGTSDFDTLYNTTNHATKKGAILYFNTKDDGTDKYTVTIKWDGTHENTYVIDLTGVKHYVPTPVYPPVSGGGGHRGSGSAAASSASVTSEKTTNGSFSVSDKNAAAGDTVKVTPKADKGYVVDEVIVTDDNGRSVKVKDNGDGTYSFVMPEKAAQPVTVNVTFKKEVIEKEVPKVTFNDVSANAWYREAVDYVVANGLMNGLDDETFAPNATTTRGMVVTILYRLEGEPGVTRNLPFADVAAGKWYSDAINWASTNGIVTGYDENTFGPDDSVTRAQMAAILYRYAELKGYNVSRLADLAGYADAAAIGSWADAAMRWAVAEGLIEGTASDTLSPNGNSTRAQIATILMRFCESVAK